MKRIVVFGGHGQLGTDVGAVFGERGWDVVRPTHAECDITRLGEGEAFVRDSRPDFIVNVAAIHDLVRCESDPAAAAQVNVVGARNVALSARQHGAYSVFVSTDYVFDGLKGEPYVESDSALPLNEYGRSKRQGEVAALEADPDSCVVRVSALFGRNPCRGKPGHNFVERMIALAKEGSNLRVVSDQLVSPTSTLAIARQLLLIHESRLRGVVHATSAGECSWYEFASAILKETVPSARLEPVFSEPSSDGIARPAYSVLINERLQESGTDVMPTWEDALAEYLVLRAHEVG